MKYILIPLIILISLIWFILPIKYLIHFTSDDAYYYLKTALNFATGKGSSFDGLNLTNGYHPLWFLILSIYYSLIKLLFNLNPELILRTTFFLITCLNIFTIYFFIKVMRQIELFRSKYSFYGTIVFTIPFTFFYVLGFESNLFITLTILYLHYYFRPDNLQRWKIRALILCLLFLTRIDLGLIISIMIIFFVESKKLEKKNLVWIISSLFATILLYLSLNKLFFGIFTSISSKYKFSLEILTNWKNFPTPISNPIDFIALTFIIVSGSIYLLHNKLNKIKSDILKPFEIFYFASLIFLFINFTLNKNGAREWYYIFPVFISAILFMVIFEKIELNKFAFYFIILISFIYFTLFRTNYYNHDSAYQFSNKLKEKVKEQEIIFQIDYSGLISFFSERIIINGDGLVNDYNYYKILKSNQLKQYLKKLKPDYFIFYSFVKDFNDGMVYYNYSSFHEYTFKFETSRIKLKHPLVHGGIFRKNYGYFYLIDTKNFF